MTTYEPHGEVLCSALPHYDEDEELHQELQNSYHKHKSLESRHLPYTSVSPWRLKFGPRVGVAGNSDVTFFSWQITMGSRTLSSSLSFINSLVLSLFEINGSSTTPEQFREICEGLKNNTVEVLHISTCSPKIRNWTSRLLKCLGKNTSLNSLFLFSDAFDLKELGRVVGHLPNLEHVQFNWMGMDDSALLLMLPAFGRLGSYSSSFPKNNKSDQTFVGSWSRCDCSK